MRPTSRGMAMSLRGNVVALAQTMNVHDALILDFGCGTGLSGLALRAAGVQVIDGCDLSEGMLAHATFAG